VSDIRSWVEEYLQPDNISGSEAQCLCVFHADSNPSMYVNFKKGVFTCFSCGAGGHISKIAKQLDIPSPDEPLVRQKQTRDISTSWVRDQMVKLQQARLDEERIDISGMIVTSERELERFKMPSDYWAERGITDEVVEEFELGYDILSYAMTIPLRSLGGHYHGVVRRFLDPEAEPRYLYPAGFDKQLMLYGAHKAKLHPRIAITEGSIDALRCWSLGIPAVAVLGSVVSERQVGILLGLGCSSYYALGDGDDAGRLLNFHLTEALGRSCHVIELPDGEDPGSVPGEVLTASFGL